MFSWVAEHPLIGNTRMSQNVLILEVREAEVRSRLKKRKPGRLSQGGGRALSAGSPSLLRVLLFRDGCWERNENRLFREMSVQETLACLSFPMKKVL